MAKARMPHKFKQKKRFRNIFKRCERKVLFGFAQETGRHLGRVGGPDNLRFYMTNQELQCPFCPKTSSRGTGLASHIRGAHPRHYSSWSRNREEVQKNGRGAYRARPSELAGGLQGIVAELEQQKSAIDRALSALRGVEGVSNENMVPIKRMRGRPRKVA